MTSRFVSLNAMPTSSCHEEILVIAQIVPSSCKVDWSRSESEQKSNIGTFDNFLLSLTLLKMLYSLTTDSVIGVGEKLSRGIERANRRGKQMYDLFNI